MDHRFTCNTCNGNVTSRAKPHRDAQGRPQCIGCRFAVPSEAPPAAPVLAPLARADLDPHERRRLAVRRCRSAA